MSGSRTAYKKPSRVYDYNYNLGEHYYKPQLRHADLRFQGRAGSPPKARTFAERFAADPVYGSYGTSAYTSPAGRKTSLTDDILGRPPRSTERFPLRGDRVFQSEDAEFGRPRFNPNEEFGEFGKPRFTFGDRLLETAGAGGNASQRFGLGPRNDSEPMGSRGIEDPFDDQFFQRGKRLGRGEGSTRGGGGGDDLAEDSFKSKSRRGFESSSTTADEMMDDMRREADKLGEASKLRSKLRASRLQQQEEDFGFSGGASDGLPESTESRIEKIRARAKARIAEAMEDDFPTSTAPTSKSYFDDFNSNPPSSANTSGGSKSVRISKRSLKTTFDIE